MAQHAMSAPHDALHGSTDWRAGILAGLTAGVVFLMLEMVMVWVVLGQSPFTPPHMIAAMALGKDVLPAPGSWAPFDAAIVVTALVIHFALSVALGLAGAWLLHRFDWKGGIGFGALFGLVIYLVNFHLVAPIAFPWFTMAQNWVSVFAHLVFGAAVGAFYIALRRPREA